MVKLNSIMIENDKRALLNQTMVTVDMSLLELLAIKRIIGRTTTKERASFLKEANCEYGEINYVSEQTLKGLILNYNDWSSIVTESMEKAGIEE